MRLLPSLFAAAVLLLAAACSVRQATAQDTPGRPNILWLTCEDMGPHIGPYGDSYAVTPNLDRFARTALRYDAVWSNAPVCAPARTGLITGMYVGSTGAEHMRSMVRLPAGFGLYPQYLREAGYYCTNNVKEDFNVEKPGRIWDEVSRRAHWRGRPAGKPFFAIFNFEITHESQIRRRPHALVHDPAKVRVPAYHPDTPEVRHDWAQYYDNITTMDAQVGERLSELEASGLADDTIVFFFSDHGSGMPRSKRTPYNSGLRVPLLVRIPEKFRRLAPADYRPGGKTDRLVSFVDFAPTLLSLAGAKIPGHFQGEAFLGPAAKAPRKYAFGCRGRMDERYDLVRSVRDDRYVYVRNFAPHKPQGQYLSYMFQTPTTRVWHDLFQAGKLNAVQSRFWKLKPAEELYDFRADPDEVKDLANDPAHAEALKRLRAELHRHQLAIRDVDLIPEAEMLARSGPSSPYELGHDPRLPLERILSTAEAATDVRDQDDGKLRRLLRDPEATVRYWAATGFRIRDRARAQAAFPELRRALQDPSPSVRIAAANALGWHGSGADVTAALQALESLLKPDAPTYVTRVEAFNAVADLGAKARPLLPLIRSLTAADPRADPRMRDYIPRLTEKIIADLER